MRIRYRHRPPGGDGSGGPTGTRRRPVLLRSRGRANLPGPQTYEPTWTGPVDTRRRRHLGGPLPAPMGRSVSCRRGRSRLRSRHPEPRSLPGDIDRLVGSGFAILIADKRERESPPGGTRRLPAGKRRRGTSSGEGCSPRAALGRARTCPRSARSSRYRSGPRPSRASRIRRWSELQRSGFIRHVWSSVSSSGWCLRPFRQLYAGLRDGFGLPTSRIVFLRPCHKQVGSGSS